MKNEAFEILLRDYTDCYGRVTLYHKSKSDPEKGRFDSENQHLWTGEAAILAEISKKLIDVSKRYEFDVNVHNFFF
jgi:hypothetical protein